MLSHGFLTGLLEVKKIDYFNKECKSFLNSLEKTTNYYKDIDKLLPEINDLYTDEIIYKAKNLLKSEISLVSSELHVQLPNCKPIPPHQDNFYHCVPFDKTLKILVPLQSLNNENGGLTFANSDYQIEIYEHTPSDLKGFSSFIKEDLYKSKNFKETTYNYSKGDCSYHFGNSIHRSNGNKSSELSMFIVFRIESKDAEIDKNCLKRYQICYEKHLKLLEKI